MAHDLRSGDRLSLGEGVAIADVEDERGWLAHWLDTDEVVGDQLGVGFADEGEGKPCEVGDVGRGGLVFQDHRAAFWVPGVELVFQDAGHEAEFLLWYFCALVQHGGPFADELVFAGFVDD